MGVVDKTIRKLRLARCHNRHRREHDYCEIDEILSRYRTDNGLRHVYQPYKLACLRGALDHYRPTRILELGTGSTTAVLADYVRQDGASLVAVDESREYLEKSRVLAGDHERIEYVHSPRVVVDGEPPQVRYRETPEGPFDLALVDGPSLKIDGRKVAGAVNSNVMETCPQVILVDMRRTTVEWLTQKLEDRYRAMPSDLFTGSIQSNYRYFSMFVRL